MDKGTATDPTRTKYGVRYVDEKGRTRERFFRTAEGLEQFLNGDSVYAVLSFTDPEAPAAA